MDAYSSYEEIPDDHRGFLDLAYWLAKNDRSIEQIPEEDRTDRLMFFHLYIKPHRFQSITTASKRYYALCEFALWRTSEVLVHIPVVFITEALVKKLTAADSRHCPLDAFKNNPQFNHLYTDELIEVTLGRSLAFLHVLQKRSLTAAPYWNAIIARLKYAPHESQYIFQFGLRARLRDEMKSGFWFEDNALHGMLGVMTFEENPVNPQAVLAQWDSAKNTWSSAWFRDNEQIFAVKMDCFSDDEVIPQLVETGLGRTFLQHFYPESRVRPFFDSNRAVRGYILEQELAV